jgi:taurine dioxygenase/putative 2-oxoglutarate oxygenase
LTEEQKKARPDVWHPIARRHPHTGWTSLYIGRLGVQGRRHADAEAQELIDFLKEFATTGRSSSTATSGAPAMR